MIWDWFKCVHENTPGFPLAKNMFFSEKKARKTHPFAEAMILLLLIIYSTFGFTKGIVRSRWWELKYFGMFHAEPWGNGSNLTNNIFQMGWFNHQLVDSPITNSEGLEIRWWTPRFPEIFALEGRRSNPQGFPGEIPKTFQRGDLNDPKAWLWSTHAVSLWVNWYRLMTRFSWLFSGVGSHERLQTVCNTWWHHDGWWSSL